MFTEILAAHLGCSSLLLMYSLALNSINKRFLKSSWFFYFKGKASITDRVQRSGTEITR